MGESQAYDRSAGAQGRGASRLRGFGDGPQFLREPCAGRGLSEARQLLAILAMGHMAIDPSTEGATRLTDAVRLDRADLCLEILRLDRALEELEETEDVTPVVEFLLRFGRRISRHSRGEEQLLWSRYGEGAAEPLRILVAELHAIEELTDDLRSLVTLARNRDPAVCDALRLAGWRLRVAVLCHRCHGDREVWSLTSADAHGA